MHAVAAWDAALLLGEGCRWRRLDISCFFSFLRCLSDQEKKTFTHGIIAWVKVLSTKICPGPGLSTVLTGTGSAFSVADYYPLYAITSIFPCTGVNVFL